MTSPATTKKKNAAQTSAQGGEPWTGFSAPTSEPAAGTGAATEWQPPTWDPAPPPTPSAVTAPTDLLQIPLAEIHESSQNPRTHFDQAGLEELAKSMATGQLTPCLVRPRPKGGYELAAGHRRFRAAKIAGLPSLLCIVRDMDDRRFLEVLTIENLQRDDLHPLEEAKGYAALMQKAIGYDVAKIAERVGRSTNYVYDRVKLLQLIPAAQNLFLDGKMEAGHAILLARLSREDQERAIETDLHQPGHVGGLFQREVGLFETLKEKGEKEPLKPVSVREFRSWIDQNVRLVEEAVDLPNLFPETFAALAAAEQAEEKVVHITYNHQLRPEVRDEEERTFGPMSWKRADGKDGWNGITYRMEKSKPCDHAVTGVIVVGRDRGQAFKVCVAKTKCRVHWPAPKKAKASAAERSKFDSYAERQRKENERYEKQQAERRALELRWKKALPAIQAAVAERVKKLPVNVGSLLGQIVLGASQIPRTKPTGKTAEDLVRFIALQTLLDDAKNYRMQDFIKEMKPLGIDVAKILDQEAPRPKEVPVPKGTKVIAEFKGAKKEKAPRGVKRLASHLDENMDEEGHE